MLKSGFCLLFVPLSRSKKKIMIQSFMLALYQNGYTPVLLIIVVKEQVIFQIPFIYTTGNCVWCFQFLFFGWLRMSVWWRGGKWENMMLCSGWFVNSPHPLTSDIEHKLSHEISRIVSARSVNRASSQGNSHSAVSTVTENFQGVAATHPVSSETRTELAKHTHNSASKCNWKYALPLDSV